MSVKRYSVWEDEMFEEKHAINSTNGMVHLMVKHEDYAALEARCAALAAENAGLKSIQEWAVAGVFKSGAKVFESTKASGFDTDDCLHDAVLVMLSELKTPATEAVLAEVRASAIETCADDMASENNIGGNEVDAMYVYAENLRKGAQS